MEIFAHRGASAHAPENTMAAFVEAYNQRADGIELDIHSAADGTFVVIHDDTLDLTTAGKGPVRDRSFEEIRRLDAGGWFDPRFSAERVPELSEVLDLTAGRCLLNIEIKASAFEAGYPADAIEHQVVALVKTTGAEDRVIISSFDWRILQRIAAMDSPPALALISDHGADRSVIERLLAMKAFSWHPRFKVLTREQVDRMHAAGLKVFPWTINTREEAQRILALGIDGLICNELQVMRTV